MSEHEGIKFCLDVLVVDAVAAEMAVVAHHDLAPAEEQRVVVGRVCGEGFGHRNFPDGIVNGCVELREPGDGMALVCSINPAKE